MNKQGLVWLLTVMVLVAVVIGVFTFHNLAEGKRYAITMFTYSVGRELIDTTNLSFLVAVSPELHAQLSQLLASTTHVASVRLGDEPSPVGDGRASSRLILTNELAQGLGIRLCLRSDASGQSKFEVLGYWKITKPDGMANGSQPIRSETNQTSPAADSRR